MRYIIIILINLLWAGNLLSQIVTGTVVETGEDDVLKPLVGATVKIMNSKVGDITDKEGKFELDLSKADTMRTMVVSFIGYTSDTTYLDGKMNQFEIMIEPIARTTGTVEVTAEKPAQFTDIKTIKQEVITQTMFRRSACCALSEAFEKNATAEVSYSDAVTGVKQIHLLGLKGDYSLLTTEIIPAFAGIANKFALEIIPSTWMENISITKGAASVVNGYEGITGQVNVDYKKSFDMKPLELNVYANSSQRLDFNLTSGLHLSSNLSTGIFASGRIFKNRQDHNSDGFIDVPENQQLNLANRWIYVTEGFEAQGFMRFAEDTYNSGQMNFDHKKSVQSQANIFGSQTNFKRYEFFTKFALLETEDNHSSTALILSGAANDLNAFAGKKNITDNEKYFYAKIVSKGEFGTTEEDYYNIGGSFSLLNRKGVYTEKIYDTNIVEKERVGGVFGEVSYSPIKDLSVVAGVRADYHNIHKLLITPRLHLKYDISEATKLRLSAGRGWRTPSFFDNATTIASSRILFPDSVLNIEEAWNFGASVHTNFELATLPVSLDIDAYRTMFVNQVVADNDANENAVFIHNVKNMAYANNLQAQVLVTLIKNFDVAFAYRYNDSRSYLGGNIKILPLQSPHRTLLTASYATEEKDWQFDGTFIWNSYGRIPISHHTEHTGEYFDGFVRLNAQVSKRFDELEFYVGAENINNFTQHEAVLGYEAPFDQGFDATQIWGPLDGRMFYLGARFSLK